MKERIIDSIGRIDDDMIERVDALRQRKKGARPAWVKWAAAAACVCLATAGALGAMKLGLFAGMSANEGGGGGEGITYMFYAGPVFPLTAEREDGDITAERHIDLDFSPYKTRTETYERELYGETKMESYETYGSKSIVTDSYVLKNDAAEDRTLTLIYPFAANLGKELDVVPTVTVNGAEVGTELHIGPYSGTFVGTSGEPEGTYNLSQLDSWEKYKTLIEAGYRARAFDELPALDQPAIVYEISDRYGEESEKAVAPTLNMEFHIDYSKTTVMTYGFNGGTNERETGYCARSVFIPQSGWIDHGERVWLIVLGEDIGDYELNAYTDGGCHERMENAGATVTRYETTLGEIVAKAVRQYLRLYDPVLYGGEGKNILSAIPEETFIGLSAELLYDYGMLSPESADRYTGMLEDIFSDARAMERVMYLSFDITVPAGGSVEVSAEMVKNASIDFIGENKGRNGYDMVTRLGSVFEFTEQTASISNFDDIEVISQSFGFDIERGVTEVALDINAPHYFIEVKKRGK